MEKPTEQLQGTNGDFLLVSKPSLGRLKTTPMFALEKHTHLQRKQTCFTLMLPVAGAVRCNLLDCQQVEDELRVDIL